MAPLCGATAFRIEPLSAPLYIEHSPPNRSWFMLDLLYLAVALGFFVLMAFYARAVSKG